MNAITFTMLCVSWIGSGVFGTWLAIERLNNRYPDQINPREDSLMYIMSVGGPCTIVAALAYRRMCPRRPA